MNFFNILADGSAEVKAMERFLEENLKKARDEGYKVRVPRPSEQATTGQKIVQKHKNN